MLTRRKPQRIHPVVSAYELSLPPSLPYANALLDDPLESYRSMFSLVPYTPHDFAAAVALFQETLPEEPMTEANFARKVLLDPNFDADGLILAKDERGNVVGGALAIRRRHVLEDGIDDRERGWITLFGVVTRCRRQGIGVALLDASERWLQAKGCLSVWISPYAPNYWTPGVDEAAYPVALSFLVRRGYEIRYRPLSMALSLADWRTPLWLRTRQKEVSDRFEAAPTKITAFTPADIPVLVTFLRVEFPGDWQRYVRETMLGIVDGRCPAEALMLLFREKALIGFAQSEGERFGPFGIAKEERGKGHGALLLCETLSGMKRRGLPNAWFLWTDDRTADRLYKHAGFRETRRYSVLCKQLPVCL